ncbi:hypothetical protein DM860_001491 [Cuscuta australis]|uniref:Uncharacterized protein n=1 Tax=Cuscuta australis TaxID=267555 RepID=A0A328ECQ4_9ASTE|nr:hypothetical protein DM860_001491 [Cuscuta australis]
MLPMNECMDIDKPDASNRSAPLNKENGLDLYRASPNESGEGLPYAPENWPNPGDKWGWKAGKRVHQAGYFVDRYLYPPSNLTLAGKPVQRKRFASKLSVKQFVQAAFPDNDVSAFFASFHWKILSKQNMLKGSESQLKHDGCKAGNTMCISLSESPGPPLEAMFCDICCSEPRFCRDCCCILCCKTIDTGVGDYSYIRCKKTVQDGCICGHLAHIECALRAYVAGTVGGSIGLDAEYFCRRCDSKTDLVFHVVDFVQACETVDSRDEIDKMLSLAICMLRGARRVTAKQLLQHIESAAAKLKTGVDFGDAWNKEAFEDTVSLLRQEDAPLNNGNGLPEWANNREEPKENNSPSLLGMDSSKFDLRAESLQLGIEIDQILQSLRRSQELEYSIAEERLLAQRNRVINLYEQIDKERSQLLHHSATFADLEPLLNAFYERVEQVKREALKLRDMKQVEMGFGRTSKHTLEEHFGLKM